MHLERLDPDDWNVNMIRRLEDIEAGKTLTNDEWNDVHSATLEDYKLFEKMDYNDEAIYAPNKYCTYHLIYDCFFLSLTILRILR